MTFLPFSFHMISKGWSNHAQALAVVQNCRHSLRAGKTFPAMVSVHWKFVHVFNRDFGSEPGSQAPGLHFSDPGPWYFLFWMGAETSVKNILRQCSNRTIQSFRLKVFHDMSKELSDTPLTHPLCHSIR